MIWRRIAGEQPEPEVRQEKNKYNSAKYRLIVRFTNKRCIAQIVYSTIEGDKVMMHADSSQLEKYGLKARSARISNSRILKFDYYFQRASGFKFPNFRRRPVGITSKL